MSTHASVLGVDLFEVLGTGTYGVVLRARDHATQEEVVVKQCDLTPGAGEECTSLREVAALRALGEHDNIAQLLRVVRDAEAMKINLVMQHGGVDLMHFLNRRLFVPHERVVEVARQLMGALAFCHEKRIMHRDVKPSNILVHEEFVASSSRVELRVRLCDFGLSRLVSPASRTFTRDVVTIWYRAPEVLLGSDAYDETIDVWAAACVVAEMLTMQPLFPLPYDEEKAADVVGCAEEQLEIICEVKGTPTEATWPGVESLPRAEMLRRMPRYPLAMSWVRSVAPRYGSLPVPQRLANVVDQMLAYDARRRPSASSVVGMLLQM